MLQKLKPDPDTDANAEGIAWAPPTSSQWAQKNHRHVYKKVCGSKATASDIKMLPENIIGIKYICFVLGNYR